MDPGPPTPHGCLSLESELGASRARESTLQTNIGAHDGKRAEGRLRAPYAQERFGRLFSP